jgi:hypothetical protein
LTFIFILFFREKVELTPLSFSLHVLIASNTATARPGNQRRKETKTGKKKKHPKKRRIISISGVTHLILVCPRRPQFQFSNNKLKDDCRRCSTVVKDPVIPRFPQI